MRLYCVDLMRDWLGLIAEGLLWLSEKVSRAAFNLDEIGYRLWSKKERHKCTY